MLTKQQGATIPPSIANRVDPARLAELELISASQQIEGFSGIITEEVAFHQVDMQAISQGAQKAGAQVPAALNLATGPLLPKVS